MGDRPPIARSVVMNTLLVDGLATWRLTQLLREDEITEPVRAGMEVLAGRAAGRPGERFVQDLFACHWCTSVWAAAGLVAVQACFPRAGRYAARTLALSAIAGALGARR